MFSSRGIPIGEHIEAGESKIYLRGFPISEGARENFAGQYLGRERGHADAARKDVVEDDVISMFSPRGIPIGEHAGAGEANSFPASPPPSLRINSMSPGSQFFLYQIHIGRVAH